MKTLLAIFSILLLSTAMSADSIRERIKSSSEWDVRELHNPIEIIGPITNQPHRGVDLRKIYKEMVERVKNGAERIEVIIDTPGGVYNSATQAFLAFMDLAKKNDVVIACTVTGQAASMGAIIMSHCHERYMVVGTGFLVHSVQISPGQRINSNNVGDLAKSIERLNATVWAKTIKLFDNIEYFNANFVIERMIPAAELATKCPDMVKLILGYKIVESE